MYMLLFAPRQGFASAVEKQGSECVFVSRSKQIWFGTRKNVVCPTYENPCDVLETLQRFHLQDIAGVLTGNEQGLFPTYVLRKYLNLPGECSFKTALNFRDKYLQKNNLPATIRRAKVVLLPTGLSELKESNVPFRLPWVIKPLMGYSTIHTYKIATTQDLRTVVEKIGLSLETPRQFIVEEFIDGEEWSIDGWFSEGRLVWFSASRYERPLISTKDGFNPSVIPLKRQDYLREYTLLEEFISSALPALGMTSDVFHLECFWDGSNITFGECAARLAGADIPDVVLHMFHVDLYEVAVNLALGKHVPRPQGFEPTQYFGSALLPAPNAMGAVISADDILKKFSVVSLEYEPPLTEQINMSYSSVSRTGTVVVSGNSELEVVRRLSEIKTYIQNAT